MTVPLISCQEPCIRNQEYPLSATKSQAMQKYISEAVSKGYIRLSTSSASVSFFFRKDALD